MGLVCHSSGVDVSTGRRLGPTRSSRGTTVIRLRSALAVAVLAAGATLVLSTPAMAQDRKCKDFAYQEDAQDFYDADTSDPSNLDQGGAPGVACESLPHRGASPATGSTDADEDQVSDVPSGSAEAGGGSTAGVPVGLVTAGGLTLLGASGLGVGALARRGRARHRTV